MTSTIARPDRGITASGPLLYLTEPRARLDQLTTRFGQPVSLIASSLGGIYSRQLARRTGHAVRQVITLGSAIRLARTEQSQANRLVGDNSRWHIETWDGDGPLPVPTTPIYSPLDGIVAWRTCLNEPAPQAENIAVSASHLGFGHHPAVIWAIADCLAQPADHWAPFRPPPLLRPAYLLPERQP